MTLSQISETYKTQPIPVLCQRAIKNAFVADALAMPVHWYYRSSDIQQAFPGGIKQFYPAPAQHPSSIMSLHSKQQGGRQYNSAKAVKAEASVVGDIILKGKEAF